MLAVLVMGVVGTYSQQATGSWNVALLGAHISGWGFVAALGAALAVLHTNAMNLCPSTVDLLVVLGLCGIGLAIAGTVTVRNSARVKGLLLGSERRRSRSERLRHDRRGDVLRPWPSAPRGSAANASRVRRH